MFYEDTANMSADIYTKAFNAPDLWGRALRLINVYRPEELEVDFLTTWVNERNELGRSAAVTAYREFIIAKNANISDAKRGQSLNIPAAAKSAPPLSSRVNKRKTKKTMAPAIHRPSIGPVPERSRTLKSLKAPDLFVALPVCLPDISSSSQSVNIVDSDVLGFRSVANESSGEGIGVACCAVGISNVCADYCGDVSSMLSCGVDACRNALCSASNECISCDSHCSVRLGDDTAHSFCRNVAPATVVLSSIVMLVARDRPPGGRRGCGFTAVNRPQSPPVGADLQPFNLASSSAPPLIAAASSLSSQLVGTATAFSAPVTYTQASPSINSFLTRVVPSAYSHRVQRFLKGVGLDGSNKALITRPVPEEVSSFGMVSPSSVEGIPPLSPLTEDMSPADIIALEPPPPPPMVPPDQPSSATSDMFIAANTSVVSETCVSPADKSSKGSNKIAGYEKFRRKTPANVPPLGANPDSGVDIMRCANLNWFPQSGPPFRFDCLFDPKTALRSKLEMQTRDEVALASAGLKSEDRLFLSR